jgi:hypothetical protein
LEHAAQSAELGVAGTTWRAAACVRAYGVSPGAAWWAAELGARRAECGAWSSRPHAAGGGVRACVQVSRCRVAGSVGRARAALHWAIQPSRALSSVDVECFTVSPSLQLYGGHSRGISSRRGHWRGFSGRGVSSWQRHVCTAMSTRRRRCPSSQSIKYRIVVCQQTARC